ncbi:SusC/RagA family TonB-linked outer membrane protein [Mucilaginibacter sp. PAMB04168]|uniref:SusC/RagA family TonB-linked outer membrane protein n=1 Tax=Mucilaginibacter sp. PAMB04168 TaxID=3138567 RepID=UPI0031F6CF3C
MKKIFTLKFLLLMMFCAVTAVAQTVEISGKVTDANDNTPVTGVTVSVKGTTTAVGTDVNGNYRIKTPQGSTALLFRFIGYTSQEIAISGRRTIDVKLAPDSKMLNEVVVNTGLGIARNKKELAYAAQSVTSEELNQNHQPNLVNALQGKVAGATISSTGGGPGQGARIIIRGVNSIDPNKSNQPLFVVDGVIIDNSTSTVGAGSGFNVRSVGNRGSDINPEDIETINVLKGGAATALYGLLGSNGVIVITTKKGKGNELRVDLTSTYGFENPDKLPKVQKEYTAGILGVYTPIGLGPAWGPNIAEAKLLDPTHPDELFDNYKQAYRTGHQNRNSLSVSGGTENARIFSSLSYFKQSGMLPFTDYRNISARLNADFKISSKFKSSVNMNFVNSGGYRYDADRFGESLAYFSPRWDVSEYLNPDGTQLWKGTNNPIYGAATNRLKDDNNRFIGGVTYSYTPVKWFDLTYRFGVDIYNENRFRTAPGPMGIPGERLYDNSDGYVGDYNNKYRSLSSTLIATLNGQITTDLKGTLRLGQDLFDRQNSSKGITGTKLAKYDLFTLWNATAFQDIVDSQYKYRLMGLFAEGTLDYKNYLFLTLSLRRDITSTLPESNRAFYYPSASLSYAFSDQFKLPEFISFGKLRLSYAKLGKDAPEYSYVNGYTRNSSIATGSTGFTRTNSLRNPELRPEFTSTYEAGLEMSFLKSRFGFDFTYYRSLSKDMITQADVSSATGYLTAFVNAGSIQNKGVELILKGSPVRSKNFSWDATLNFSANRNKVVETLNHAPVNYGGNSGGYLNSPVTLRLVEGEAYGNLYGTVWQRYGADPNATKAEKDLPLLIGANGFPVLGSVNNLKILGNSQPRWIGGLSNTFTYKRLSLTALLDGRWGLQKFNRLENFFAAFGIADYTADRRQFKVFDGLLANGQPNTKSVWLGQATGPDGVNYGEGYYRTYYRAISEPFVSDASWIRLRSASLSYNIPNNYLPKFIKRASASVTGTNLWLHTNYYGLDPESVSADSGSNVDGWSGFTYPAARQFFFTINVGF